MACSARPKKAELNFPFDALEVKTEDLQEQVQVF